MDATVEPPSTEQPLDWIRQVPGELFNLDEIPLLGFHPPFPWEDFAAQIQRSFQIEDMKLTPAEWQWRDKDKLLDGFGGELKSISLVLAPLAGSVCWAMPEKDISSLIEGLFAKEKLSPATSVDPDFCEGFYRFLIAEVISAFEKVDFDKQLSPSPMPSAGTPSCHCLCLDVQISLQQGSSLHGRLFLTPEFRKSWAQRYQQQQSKAVLSTPLADKLSVIIHLEAGKASLTPSEWKQVKIGDLLLLDSCSLDPEEDKGRVMLVINGIPFFRGKIKQGSIKILEHPLYHEVDTNMTNPPDQTEGHEENDEEDDFDNSEFDDDTETETENGESETTSELEDEDFDIEDETEETEIEDAKPQAKAPPSATGKPTVSAAPPPPSAEVSASSRPMSIEDVPLSIVIEAGRIQMSIKKIIELQPGNLLDLNIHPETGVDLVVNGRRIAKGELLRIGDAIGVRIVELS